MKTDDNSKKLDQAIDGLKQVMAEFRAKVQQFIVANDRLIEESKKKFPDKVKSWIMMK